MNAGIKGVKSVACYLLSQATELAQMAALGYKCILFSAHNNLYCGKLQEAQTCTVITAAVPCL